ncbi:hypothetical protein I8748_18620 [Nostoc sp. CENA67]|uniref:Uncharacterized protein n=1 Tax=Amazonocrinis nigriterrae CENA67 TaxID=2794033 RepID=A0A8J7HQN6_9NOST|nr:hypothetical protein [Amazonocrinis nigriterrae]MBH8564176.1 hypothetical protein [Amazonocrinis nigriterrae CENA67]
MIIEIPRSLYQSWVFEVDFDEGETGIDMLDCVSAWIAGHNPQILHTPEPVYLQVQGTDILIPVKQ